MIFHTLVSGGHKPIQSDESAFGTLPTEAYRYCEPVRTASAFGYYVFLPVDLALMIRDGTVLWSLDHFETTYPLSKSIQYPGFSAMFDGIAPDNCKGYAPPFLTKTNSHDIVQIWTGLIAETEEGIVSLIRAPVNIKNRSEYEIMEGIVDTDWWLGPLFTNIIIKKTDVPIYISKDMPFLQVTPLPRSLVKGSLAQPVVSDFDALSGQTDFWGKYAKTIPERVGKDQKVGDYAVISRKKK